MTLATAYLPLMRRHAPGASDEVLADELVRLAGDFCRETRVWERTATAQDIRAGEALYDIVTPVGSEMAEVKRLMASGRTLPMTPEIEMDRYSDTWTEQTGSGPLTWFLTPGDQVRLYPIPDRDVPDALKVTVILAPSPGASELPDALWRYREALARGAVGHLLQAPDGRIGDPAKARVFINDYERARSRAKVRVLTGGTGVIRIPVPAL